MVVSLKGKRSSQRRCEQVIVFTFCYFLAVQEVGKKKSSFVSCVLDHYFHDKVDKPLLILVKIQDSMLSH